MRKIFTTQMETGVEVDQVKKNKFKLRPFISLVLFFSLALMLISGLAMYLRPEGSVARWTNWEMLGLDKKGWEGVHTFFCLAFVLAAAAHLVLNLRTFLRYLCLKMEKTRRNPRELMAAASLVTTVLIVAALRIPPASTVMDLRSDIKNGSAVIQIQPPAPGFENRSLKEISAFLGVSVEKINIILKENGIEIPGPEQSLTEVAERNRTSPQRLYALILHSLP
jgi:hypothetical protein